MGRERSWKSFRERSKRATLVWLWTRRILARGSCGLIAGYVSYLVIMLAYEKWAYGRWDEEKVFWALYCPFISPIIASSSGRASLSPDETFLVPAGGALLLVSVVLFIWAGKRPTAKPPKPQ
jgi:hypothetical protein